MGKYVYNGTDITDIVEEKEKNIINLYSQDKGITLKRSKDIYMHSTLKKAIRDVDNGLWMQSEYYIMEAYVSYLDQVKIREPEGVKFVGTNRKGKIHFVKAEKSLESLQALIPKPEHVIIAGKRNSKNKKNKVGVAAARSIHGEKVKR